MKYFFKSTMWQKITAIAFFIFTASTPTLSQASNTSKDSESANFWLFPDASNNTGVWLLNTKNGSLSKCIFISTNTAPECSPWANPPGQNPEYRYDMKSKKLIPMNEAARNKEKINSSKNH